ncbi:2-amino-4-hydroxy-6-hydroxymethyldihydropteridine diphosphokinase [Ectothiorhodospiraceae bacterium 2226]|nr:2-amino-4-hydroxy-6-hydroxymethyldihydropteridine diphosphokinase [Ectothiorhodospiraceae bacterium 2226]
MNAPVRVYVSVGSNVEPARYVRAGIRSLRERFGVLQISSVYESEAVGFAGDNFYNLVVGFDTTESVTAVARTLQAIEDAHGRDRTGPRFSPRTLDLDLLLYGEGELRAGGLVLPRPEITEHAFVLRPLAELAGGCLHPGLGRSYADLWAAFDADAQPLWPIELGLDD